LAEADGVGFVGEVLGQAASIGSAIMSAITVLRMVILCN
jgi:hypothetical protein